MHPLLDFIFPRRLHRLAYFLRCMAADFVTYFLYSYVSATHSKSWWLTIIAISIYAVLFITVPRLRDLNMSAWWFLVFFVPILDFWLGIVLLFRAPDTLSHARSGLPHEAAIAMP